MKWTIYEQRRLRKAISDIRSWTDLSEWYETIEKFFRDYLDERFFVDTVFIDGNFVNLIYLADIKNN